MKKDKPNNLEDCNHAFNMRVTSYIYDNICLLAKEKGISPTTLARLYLNERVKEELAKNG